jgi:hypothetical protein
MATDAKERYIMNAIPYLGKEELRLTEQRVVETVTLHLLEPFLDKGRNVTIDNFCKSLSLTKELTRCMTSIVGTRNDI